MKSTSNQCNIDVKLNVKQKWCFCGLYWMKSNYIYVCLSADATRAAPIGQQRIPNDAGRQ